MPKAVHSKAGGGWTPCCLPLSEWKICYDNGCYLNYRCPVYRGCRPNPERDYLPLPAVFVLIEPFEAFPISFHVPGPDWGEE